MTANIVVPLSNVENRVLFPFKSLLSHHVAENEKKKMCGNSDVRVAYKMCKPCAETGTKSDVCHLPPYLHKGLLKRGSFRVLGALKVRCTDIDTFLYVTVKGRVRLFDARNTRGTPPHLS